MGNLPRASHLYTADRRALALFRMALGVLCLIDLSVRVPLIEWVYAGDAGLAPMSAGDRSWSLYALSPEASTSWLLMGLTAGVAALMTVGLATRAAAVFLWVLISSLHGTAFPHYGGDFVMNMLLFLAMWLPLGDVWSVDAWRAARAGCPRPQGPHASVIVCALRLQLAAIYLITALAKNGATWQDGTAIHYLLEYAALLTPIGDWCRTALPSGVLAALTYGTLVIEYLLPLLILAPWGGRWPASVRPTYRLAMLLIALLHASIALMADVMVFSYAMMTAGLLLFHTADLDALARRVGKPVGPAETTTRATGLERGVGWAWLVLQALVVVEQHALIREASDADDTLPVVGRVASAMGWTQRWPMFAPNPPRLEDQLIIEALTRDGQRVDALTGAPFAVEPARYGSLTVRGSLWVKVIKRVYLDQSGATGARIRDLAVGRWNADPSRSPIVRARAILVVDEAADPDGGPPARVVTVELADVPKGSPGRP